MNHEIRDITIIGGGPTGLFALFYAGMRGATAQIVDALGEPGGQLTALYPEKYIFDVAGFPKVLAKDLVRALCEQAAQFAQPMHYSQRVVGLEEQDGHFVLVTESDRFPTRAIVIAAGIGAFAPRRLPQAAAEPWYGRGIHDVVTDPERFRGRHVVIIGGGDSAFDWGTQLLGRAASVTIVHRSDRFRAHDATVAQLTSPKYAMDSSGRIKVEAKPETKARLGRSPDDADALLLAFYQGKGQGAAFLDMWRGHPLETDAAVGLEERVATRLLQRKMSRVPVFGGGGAALDRRCQHRWRGPVCVFCGGQRES
ncbi:MAG: hypothetical protein B7Z72_01545 [Gemmatimonadetes bacterium 21-71-4]|nr:MAG: hypothetical protein B7Z72_01545 [Gemmatimonadetes bacterium 21-71-4]